MRKICFYLTVFFLVSVGQAFGCTPATVEPQATKAPVSKQEAPVKASWQTEWDKTLAAAKQEGKVTLYTTLGTEMRTVLGESLKNTYGLDLDIVSGATTQVIAKMTAEHRAGLNLADAYIGGSSSQIILRDTGLTQPVEPFLVLPDVLDKKAWLGGDLLFLDKSKQILIFASHVNTPLVINRDMVVPPIKAAKELLDLKWKGKILLMDPTIPGAGSLFMTAAGELLGENFIRQLATQEPTVVRDYRTHVEWVARGKFPIGTGPNPEQIQEFVKVSAPIAMPTLSDLNFISSATGIISIPVQPSHPNAAKVFVNWFLSKEGQTAYVKGTGSQSRRLDVTTEYTSPERIRQSGVKYLDTETEEMATKRLYYQNLDKEIFAEFMK